MLQRFHPCCILAIKSNAIIPFHSFPFNLCKSSFRFLMQCSSMKGQDWLNFHGNDGADAKPQLPLPPPVRKPMPQRGRRKQAQLKKAVEPSASPLRASSAGSDPLGSAGVLPDPEPALPEPGLCEALVPDGSEVVPAQTAAAAPGGSGRGSGTVSFTAVLQPAHIKDDPPAATPVAPPQGSSQSVSPERSMAKGESGRVSGQQQQQHQIEPPAVQLPAPIAAVLPAGGAGCVPALPSGPDNEDIHAMEIEAATASRSSVEASAHDGPCGGGDTAAQQSRVCPRTGMPQAAQQSRSLQRTTGSPPPAPHSSIAVQRDQQTPSPSSEAARARSPGRDSAAEPAPGRQPATSPRSMAVLLQCSESPSPSETPRSQEGPLPQLVEQCNDQLRKPLDEVMAMHQQVITHSGHCSRLGGHVPSICGRQGSRILNINFRGDLIASHCDIQPRCLDVGRFHLGIRCRA